MAKVNAHDWSEVLARVWSFVVRRAGRLNPSHSPQSGLAGRIFC
jgi:hypothetical protein